MRLIKILIILSIIMFLSTEMSFARSSIRGIIIDAKTKQPVVGVSVSLDDGFKGTIVDFKGRFEIKNLPEKYFLITFDSYEYKKLKIDSFLVSPYENNEIDTFYLERVKKVIEVINDLKGSEILDHTGPGRRIIVGREQVVNEQDSNKVLDSHKREKVIEEKAYTFSGYIFSKEDSLPIQNSVVKIYDTKLGALPNSEGYFIVKNIKQGKYHFTIKSLDFKGLSDTLIIDTINVVDTFYFEKRIKNRGCFKVIPVGCGSK